MNTEPLVSIIVDNYNYGRFLPDAIDSALGQTYARVEVIVVDDGSTDDSPQVIARYGSRITPVLKKNGGQGSACNAAFRVSNGTIVMFLDADDLLLPTAVEKAVPHFRDPDLIKVHWPLWYADERGNRTCERFPDQPLPEGDLRETVLRVGPGNLVTSGLAAAYHRSFLDRVFPVPEAVFRNCVDTYLFELAPFYGPMAAIQAPQGLYRQHGGNDHLTISFHDNLARELRIYDSVCAVLMQHLGRLGMRVDLEEWKRNSWWHELEASARDIAALPEPGRPFILVDDASWGAPLAVAGRRPIPFPEDGGEYAGRPDDDATAIAELERLRGTGAAFIAFASPCRWWLEHYRDFHDHLRSRYPSLLHNDRLAVFDLRN
jgi:glycosyltransferase involved in cell wall biosynthesis